MKGELDGRDKRRHTGGWRRLGATRGERQRKAENGVTESDRDSSHNLSHHTKCGRVLPNVDVFSNVKSGKGGMTPSTDLTFGNASRVPYEDPGNRESAPRSKNYSFGAYTAAF